WHGLHDVETRYRQRYVDLVVNPDVRRIFRMRAAVITGLRRFLTARDYVEVETPMMQPIPGGAAARPVVTHPNALDVDLYLLLDRDTVAAVASRRGIAVGPDASAGHLLGALFEALVEPTLVQPTFVTRFPVELSPLARRNDGDPRFVDRFELIVAGHEIANAFSELNDPDDQRGRFEEQRRARAAGDLEAQAMDEDYLRALEYGLQPTAGEGIGVDCLVMLLTGATSIREVILFPQLRPESPA